MDENIKVKDFIYLNTDYLQSYVSQTDEAGLLLRQHQKVTQTNSDTENIVDGYTVKRKKITGGIPGLGVEADRENRPDYYETITNQSSAWEKLADYELHDSIYYTFLQHARETGMITESPEISKYVELKGKYDFIDMAYCDDLFQDKTLTGKMPKQKGSGSPSDVRTVIETCRRLLPNDCFITMCGVFAPLKTEHLRESSKEINFKYSGEISMMCKITAPYGNINEEDKSEAEGVITFIKKFNNSIPQIIELLGLPKDTKFIASPIALYF